MSRSFALCSFIFLNLFRNVCLMHEIHIKRNGVCGIVLIRSYMILNTTSYNGMSVLSIKGVLVPNNICCSNWCGSRCDTVCEHGVCDHYNTCHCHPGYMRKNSTCVPIDTQILYNKFPNSSCEEGYEQNFEYANICDPVCNDLCRNGICVAPNTCECFEGYKLYDKKHYGFCNPIDQTGSCPREECDCPAGYRSRQIYPTQCIPQCERGCKNGYCLTPENCTCYSGFKKNGTECVLDENISTQNENEVINSDHELSAKSSTSDLNSSGKSSCYIGIVLGVILAIQSAAIGIYIYQRTKSRPLNTFGHRRLIEHHRDANQFTKSSELM